MSKTQQKKPSYSVDLTESLASIDLKPSRRKNKNPTKEQEPVFKEKNRIAKKPQKVTLYLYEKDLTLIDYIIDKLYEDYKIRITLSMAVKLAIRNTTLDSKVLNELYKQTLEEDDRRKKNV